MLMYLIMVSLLLPPTMSLGPTGPVLRVETTDCSSGYGSTAPSHNNKTVAYRLKFEISFISYFLDNANLNNDLPIVTCVGYTGESMQNHKLTPSHCQLYGLVVVVRLFAVNLFYKIVQIHFINLNITCNRN